MAAAAALQRGTARGLALATAVAASGQATPDWAEQQLPAPGPRRLWRPPGHGGGARAAGQLARCQAASVRSATSHREHNLVHEADFTLRMREISNTVDFRTMLSEGCFLLEGVDDNIVERLVFGDKVFATKGTKLIEQGQENSDVFVVGHGLLSVNVGGVQVASVGPGQVIGLYTMLKKTPASADVRVDSDVAYVLVLRHSHFMGCLDGSPEVLERMKMLLRQREMQNRAAEMVSKSAQ